MTKKKKLKYLLKNIMDDVWPDELFVLQQRNGAIIYSGETALYLHGLTDREYSSVCVTVPQGYNASYDGH